MATKKSGWMKYWLNGWLPGVIGFGFASIISFFQINSYWADKHHFNGIFGWLGIGIVTGLAFLYFVRKVIISSGGQGG